MCAMSTLMCSKSGAGTKVEARSARIESLHERVMKWTLVEYRCIDVEAVKHILAAKRFWVQGLTFD